VKYDGGSGASSSTEARDPRRSRLFDFDALHSGKQNEEVQLCVFDIFAEGGDDLRKLPLSMPKAKLERLLARRPKGIFVNPFEAARLVLFCSARSATWLLRVWSRNDRPYQTGRSKHWVKVKNRKHPAMERVMDSVETSYRTS
jgi:bifunctional non-homologous end joining protein LigD